MKPQSKPPVFLVGCPRSGTTLLQSLLAAHPQIASFPESKFFQYLVPEHEPRRRFFGLVSRRLQPRLEEFFKSEIGRPEMLQYLPQIPLMSWYTRKFIKILQILTEEQGKSIMLEKTPEHLYHIDYIEKIVPGVRFIHILRNGSDVVASLYEVTRKYPNSLWQGALSLDDCIERWIQAVEISRRHLHKLNHLLIRYEDLVENPPTELEKICGFIGIEFIETMLQDYRGVAKQVTLETEPWKAAVTGEIHKVSSQKFDQMFDEAQQQYIRKRLSGVSLDE